MNQLWNVATLVLSAMSLSNFETSVDALHDACKRGDKTHLQALLQHSDELFRKYGKNPLHLSVEHDHVELARTLVQEYKWDVNNQTSDDTKNRTPLMLACANNNAEMLAFLIHDAGANVNLSNDAGVTALCVAAKQGNINTAQALIQAGASVNQAKNGCISPLWTASYFGHTDMVTMLIEAGAEVDALTKGTTPLLYASERGHSDVVRTLLQYSASPHFSYNTATPLWLAASYGHTDIVALLIKANADLNTLPNPLMVAVLKGHRDVVALLLKAGAEVDKAAPNGGRPLHLASSKGHRAVVADLINAGADINKPTKDGTTPLWSAACTGHTNAVRMLIQAGAQINLCRKDGISPALIAGRRGHADAVKLLITNGATLTYQDLDDIAVLNEDYFLRIVAILTNYLKKNSKELPKYQAVMQNVVDYIANDERLIESKTGKLCALLYVYLFPTIKAPEHFIALGHQQLKLVLSTHEAFRKSNVLDQYLTDLLLTEFVGLPNVTKRKRQRNQDLETATKKRKNLKKR